MGRVGRIAGGAVLAASIAGSALGADIGQPIDSGCVRAVSGPNGKLEGAAGYIDDAEHDGARAHVGASMSFPLGCLLGVQLDGSFGSMDKDPTGGGAAHVFLRDPTTYLLGAQSQYLVVERNEIWRIGGEVQLYFSSFSLEAFAGYEHSEETRSDFAAAADLGFYANENLRLTVGYKRFLETDVGAAAIEWHPGIAPVSLFTEGQIGTHDYATVLGGVRVYLGGTDKSLILRHREDDPHNLLYTMIRDVPKHKSDGRGEAASRSRTRK